MGQRKVAVKLLIGLAQHPPEHTEVVIVPFLNIDRRLVVEQDLINEERKYRRVNSGGEDLNRDYEIHEATAFERHLFPERYSTSSSPLSQPESKAIDNLFAQEHFNAAVSVHAASVAISITPGRPLSSVDNWEMFPHLGTVMKSAQSGKHLSCEACLIGCSYLEPKVQVDHFYGKYSTKHSSSKAHVLGFNGGVNLIGQTHLDSTIRDPTLDTQRTVESMWALIRHYDRYLITDETECLVNRKIIYLVSLYRPIVHEEQMIEVHLSRYYGDFAAISNISFSIQRHEIVGFRTKWCGKINHLKYWQILSPSSGDIHRLNQLA